MWILLAAVAAACFALNAIFIRLGMRSGAKDNGHFLSVLVNTLVLGCVLLALVIRSGGAALPRWSWAGLGVFTLAGLLGTGLGRAIGLAAIRLIGPARQGAFQIAAPLFTLLFGWLFLAETINVVQGLGGLLVLTGLGWLMRSRITAEPLVSYATTAAAVANVSELSGGQAGGRGAEPVLPELEQVVRRGFAFGVASALFFGLSFVARKYGMVLYPHAVAGAFAGALAALVFITGFAVVRGELRQLLRNNLRPTPWWFVAGGTATSLALILQFAALSHLPAWIPSLLHGTQAIWLLIFSRLFLGDEERLGIALVTAVLLTTGGVAIMTIAGR